MTFSKYEVRFIHNNQAYKINLHDTDKEGGVSKISVGGHNYGISQNEEIPTCANNLFASLKDKNFLKDSKRLLNALSSDPNVNCVALTKQTYNIATNVLVKKKNYESPDAEKLKDKTYNDLISALPDQVEAVIQRSNCSPLTLFEIANEIQSEGNVELANAIREKSRPFNLTKTVDAISEKILLHHFNEVEAQKIVLGVKGKLDAGSYEELYDKKEFADRLQQDLRDISSDLHFGVDPVEEILEEKIQMPSERMEKARLEATNFGFVKMELLKDANAAFVEINKMENPRFTFEGKEITKERALAVIKQIRDWNPAAIIIDLRKNSGESPYMSELLINQFNNADEEKILGDFKYSREILEEDKLFFPVDPTKLKPKQENEERILDIPIYILTSQMTMSAAEDFACHMKELNSDNERIQLIGERTAGASNLAELFNAGEDFKVAVPIGGEVISYDGYDRNWEGSGITPHIEVDAEEALDVAKEIIKQAL